MSESLSSTLASDYAAALDWWREAGVDLDYADAPTAWLREAEAEPDIAPSPPPRTVPRQSATPAIDRALARDPAGPIGGDRARWPTDLAGFRAFWLAEPSLDPGPRAERIAPRGEAGAALMVLVGMPDVDDRGHLLSGSQGGLLDRILLAMGLARSAVYVASALPRVTPMPRWEDLAARGLSAVTRHHIALATPARIIAFGKPAAGLAGDCDCPLLAAPQLETLARSAAHKRRFWQDWLQWSA